MTYLNDPWFYALAIGLLLLGFLLGMVAINGLGTESGMPRMRNIPPPPPRPKRKDVWGYVPTDRLDTSNPPTGCQQPNKDNTSTPPKTNNQ